MRKNGGKPLAKVNYNNSGAYKPEMTVVDILKMESADWLGRGLRRETLERFGVKVQFRAEEGALGNPIAVYFPYRNKSGDKIVGYKRKNLTKDKSEPGHFSVIGRVDVSCMLFGEKEARKSAKKLIIAEGELDQLSIYQSLCDSVKGTEFAKYTPAVVSPHLGTPNSLKSIINRDEFVSKYKEVVLAFDNDCRGPLEKSNVIRGAEATDAIGCYLTKQKVHTVPWPDWINDANDLLMQGKDNQLANLIKFDTVSFKADKVVSVSDISFEDLITPKELGVQIGVFPKLNAMLGGIRKREFGIITAMSNVGKTAAVSEIAYNLAEESQEKISLLYLEENAKETLLRMIARKLEVNYYKFVFDPLKYAKERHIREAREWCMGRFFFLDIFGGLPVDEMLSKIKNLYHVAGCGFTIIDHLSMLTSALSQMTDERREIDRMLVELASFVAKNDSGIIGVSHLNRGAKSEIGNVSDLKNPKWVCVNKESMRGSASFEQLCWWILGLEYELQPDRSRGRVRWTVLKNRTMGTLGEADTFTLEDSTGKVLIEKDGSEGGGY